MYSVSLRLSIALCLRLGSRRAGRDKHLGTAGRTGPCPAPPGPHARRGLRPGRARRPPAVPTPPPGLSPPSAGASPPGDAPLLCSRPRPQSAGGPSDASRAAQPRQPGRAGGKRPAGPGTPQADLPGPCPDRLGPRRDRQLRLNPQADVSPSPAGQRACASSGRPPAQRVRGGRTTVPGKPSGPAPGPLTAHRTGDAAPGPAPPGLAAALAPRVPEAGRGARPGS